MNDPVLICLPVRNGGSHLPAAIASIRAQTDGDWRLAVLDNRSTDDTPARVRAAGDPRIALYEAEQPLSITASWDRILPLVAAEPADRLVTLIGHDDLLKPDFVATIRRLAREDPSATLFQTQFELIDGDGAPIRPARPIPLREEAGDLLAALCWGLRDSFGTGYAFRAADYVRVGGIPPLPRLLYADHLLFARLTALGHKRCADTLGCSYRLHAGSASNGVSPERLADHALALDRFVAAVRQEFAGFVHSDRGHLALARLLARELLILEAPGVRRALSSAGNGAVIRLRERLAATGVPPSAGDGRLFDHARRWSVALRLVRHRLAARG